MRRYGRFTVVLACGLLLLGLLGCGNGGAENGAQPPQSETESPGAGESTGGESPDAGQDAARLAETKCTMCHTYDRVESADYSREEWESTVTRMQQNGLVVTDEEKATIVEYLAEQDAK